MNKKNKNVRYISYEILLDFITNKSKLSEVIDSHIVNNKINDNDTSFITEISYGVIRNFYLLEYQINEYSKNNKINNKVMTLIMLGAYQIHFLESVPSYAAIDTTVELSKSIAPYATGFVNAILRKIDNQINYSNNIPKYIKESFPEWLYKIYLEDFGEKSSHALLEYQNLRPTHWIRINNNNNIINDLFNNNNIKFSKSIDKDNYINVKTLNNEIIKNLLLNGDIYIQSPSSGFVVDIVEPLPGDSIIDACSSPGGKLSDIYLRCNKLNKLKSFEIDTNRFNKLNKNINTMHMDNLTVMNESFINCMDRNFNKILIDVPCSGTGSISKKPDIKIRRNYKDYDYFNLIQKSLLNHAASLVGIDGVVVYATCSLNDLENWNIVDDFLSNNTNFYLSNISNLVPKKYIDKKGALFIKPHEHKLDGIFAVKLVKQND